MGNQTSFPDLEHQTVKYPNGDVYIGQIREGKRHGYGEYKSETGNQYAGQWREGMRHGRGELHLAAPGPGAEGDPDSAATQWSGTYEGMFERNERCGRGTFTAPDGSVYVGEWMGDVKHGEGILTLQDCEIHGIWEHGLQHGPGTIKLEDGSEIAGTWKHGERDGLFILTTKDRVVEEVWSDGLLVNSREVDDLEIAKVLGVEDEIMDAPSPDEAADQDVG